MGAHAAGNVALLAAANQLAIEPVHVGEQPSRQPPRSHLCGMRL